MPELNRFEENMGFGLDDPNDLGGRFSQTLQNLIDRGINPDDLSSPTSQYTYRQEATLRGNPLAEQILARTGNLYDELIHTNISEQPAGEDNFRNYEARENPPDPRMVQRNRTANSLLEIEEARAAAKRRPLPERLRNFFQAVNQRPTNIKGQILSESVSRADAAFPNDLTRENIYSPEFKRGINQLTDDGGNASNLSQSDRELLGRQFYSKGETIGDFSKGIDWRSDGRQYDAQAMQTKSNIESDKNLVRDASNSLAARGVNTFRRGFGVLNRSLNPIKQLRYPTWLSNALQLRNPVIESGYGVRPGQILDQDSMGVITQTPKRTGSGGGIWRTPWGTVTNLVYTGNRGGPTYDLAFTGPMDSFATDSQARGEANKLLQRAQKLRMQNRGGQPGVVDISDMNARRLDLSEAKTFENRAANIFRLIDNPLKNPAASYTLGTALQYVPVGGIVKAAPIGGSEEARFTRNKSPNRNLSTFGEILNLDNDYAGVRSRKYRLASTDPTNVVTDASGTPLARQPGALQGTASSGEIQSLKTSPRSWTNVRNVDVNWDPQSLKIPFIRMAFGLGKDPIPEEMVSDPKSIIRNPDRADFSKPVITPDSTVGRLRTGLKGAFGIGLTDLIPTRTAVQRFAGGDTAGGLKEMGTEYVRGIPTAAAFGTGLAFVPAAAPLAPGIVGGITLTRGTEALDEAVKQKTGEGLLTKLRQALGTNYRTGIADRRPITEADLQAQLNEEPVIPEIKQGREMNPFEKWLNYQNKRVAMAKEAWNPSQLEFGISEYLDPERNPMKGMTLKSTPVETIPYKYRPGNYRPE